VFDLNGMAWFDTVTGATTGELVSSGGRDFSVGTVTSPHSNSKA
jgi:hypothetical protein